MNKQNRVDLQDMEKFFRSIHYVRVKLPCEPFIKNAVSKVTIDDSPEFSTASLVKQWKS